jgi:chitobiase/beta-hexosaminidase-like protein/Big-like domain-containing protein
MTYSRLETIALFLQAGGRPRLAPLWALIVALLLSMCAGATLDAQVAQVATVGLTPGWATFGQALPQGAATGGLQVGSLTTQTDVKNTWPDGSIRFAVVTVKATTAGNFAITPTAASAGPFAPGLPTAAVALTIDGVAYTADLPPVPAGDRWLSGPLVYEGRSIVAPASSANGAAHPFLRVIFDTRVYNDGEARVDVTVENTLDIVGAATTSYDVAITVNGASVFTQAAVQHFYLTRWRKTFAASSATFASITPDVEAFNRAKATPAFVTSVVTNVVSTPAAANFGILKSGALDPIMSDHGGRAELAPLPDWTARYLVHKDPAQRAFVLANGDLAGSWPMHVREAETGSRRGLGTERLISLDERPNLWLDERAQGGDWDYIAGSPLPMREYGSDIPAAGQSPLLPDNAHQPSIAFVPYLLTGDRYYAEEMAFWANYGMVRTYPGDGVRSSQGILANNEVRGFGWALRNLVDAAAYYPDASPVKAYLSQKVINNLQWLDAYARSQDPVANPFQILWVNRRPDGGQYISLWEQTYLAYAIDRANQHGFTGGLAHRDAIARFHLTLFTSEPDYPRAQAGAYLIAIGPADQSTPGVFGGSFFKTIAEIWAASMGQERPFAGFYGPEARLNLIYGIQNGWPGAQAAYDYLWPLVGTVPAGCVTLGGDLPDLTCRSGWALDVPSMAAPSPAPAQLTTPTPGSSLASDQQVFNWTPGVGVSRYQLTVGTAQGANDLYSGTETTNVSASVAGLPRSGGRIWVRLSSLVNDGWLFTDASYVAANTPAEGGTPRATPVGSRIAGTFNDATGHSAQSHLLYAPNAGVWWLFTLSSAHDSVGDHTVRSYYSNGPNLATATWTAAAPSPHLANAGFATDSVFAGGRSLGAAVLSVAGTDYAHLFASTAFDGQVSSNGHIRARLGANSIGWEAWNNPGSPNSASEWQGPATSGHPPSAASTHSSWGNVVGISTGGFIHHSSVTMDQEVDCNVARSTNADIAAVWGNGFGTNAVGASPPNTTAVIDKSMTFQCKSIAFAPLASNVMLAVYSNGAVAQPNLTNLRFQRSGANGTWTNVSTSGGGNGHVFSTDATVDANDWALVPVSTSAVYAFRRVAAGTAIDGAAYVPGSNTWAVMASAPPPFGSGQRAKSGAGLFGATDGTSIWLFFINSDSASSILYSKFDGTAWTPWATVPGTGSGTATRNFISGYPRVVGHQVGLIWTEGTTDFDVVAAALDTEPPPPDTVAPTVTATPAPGTFTAAQSVTLVASEQPATIYYTVDGTAPAVSSAQYVAPIAIAATKTIRYLALDAAGNSSSGSLLYTIAVAPAPGPTATAPVTSIVNHSTLTTTAVPVTLAWSATAGAGGSTVARYELQQSADGGTTWTPIALPTALTTSVVRTIVPSTTTSYVFRLRATDTAGAVGPFAVSAPFTVSAAQESDPNIAYVGAWPIAARANAFGGSTSSSSVAGSTATYTFTGSYVAWVTEKDPTHGQTVVSIDGVATPMIDNYNAGSLTRRVMFVRALSPGTHTIELKVLATKNAAATGTRTDVDTFIVFGAPSEAPPAPARTTTTISAAAINWPASGVVAVTVASTGGVPPGSVSLAVDGGTAATQPLVNGVANFPIAVATVGTHTLAASYTAQAGFDASTAIGSLLVKPAPTTTTITAPAITLPANGTVTVTVTSTGSTPTGSVSLSVDGGAATTQPLAAGVATFNVPSPPVGTRTLTATYAAEGTFSASTATGTLVVNGTATVPGPTATAPVPSIVNHSTLTTTAVAVTLAWSATAGAGGSAVKTYELQQSIDRSTTWTPIALPGALTTTIVRSIVPSTTTSYLFRVRATDTAGTVGAFAVSAPLTVSAAQESDPNIAYVGAWPIAARANAFGGATSSNSVAGSTATYTFTGSYVAWVTEKDPTHGQTVVSIDGVATPMIDNYNAGSLTRRVMFVQALSPGTHTITLTVLATRAVPATGTRTDVDTFIVFGAPAEAPAASRR